MIRQSDRFVGAKEAASFLGFSIGALYCAVARREIPSYRLGAKRLRFKLTELRSVAKPMRAGGGVAGDDK